MTRTSAFRLAATAVLALAGLALLTDATAQQTPDPNSPRFKGVLALQAMIEGEDPAQLQTFLEERIASGIRTAMGDAAVLAALAGIREELAGASERGARPNGPLSATMMLNLDGGGEASLAFELDAIDTDRFIWIKSPGHEIGG